MPQVSMKNSLPVEPEKLWDTIGGFNALPDWHPAVESSTLEEGGTVRRLALVGGGEIVERLEKKNDEEYTYSYSIESSPLPVANYTGTLSIHSDDDGGSEVRWSSSFEAEGASGPDAEKIIEGIYQAGFDNLKKMFGL